MRQHLFVFLLVITSFVAKSQTSNILSESDYQNIKINNVSITDIKKAKGKKASVEKLLGAATSFTKDENEIYHYFKFNGLSVDFVMRGKSKPYVESFEINNNQASLSIKGTAVTVGDNISKLGEVVFMVARNGAKSILYTDCEDCDSFVNIEFDQATNVITKISYMDMS